MIRARMKHLVESRTKVGYKERGRRWGQKTRVMYHATPSPNLSPHVNAHSRNLNTDWNGYGPRPIIDPYAPARPETKERWGDSEPKNIILNAQRRLPPKDRADYKAAEYPGLFVTPKITSIARFHSGIVSPIHHTDAQGRLKRARDWAGIYEVPVKADVRTNRFDRAPEAYVSQRDLQGAPVAPRRMRRMETKIRRILGPSKKSDLLYQSKTNKEGARADIETSAATTRALSIRPPEGLSALKAPRHSFEIPTYERNRDNLMRAARSTLTRALRSREMRASREEFQRAAAPLRYLSDPEIGKEPPAYVSPEQVLKAHNREKKAAKRGRK